VEPGRQTHRLLPVRPVRGAGIHAHQLHRRPVSVDRSARVRRPGPDQCLGAHRRSRGRGAGRGG
jgi:hypothetical protein